MQDFEARRLGIQYSAARAFCGCRRQLRSSTMRVQSLNEIVDALLQTDELVGIAIDGPLVINNQAGQRDCEKEVSRAYGSRKAGCHPSNLSLYPDPSSVRLSNRLLEEGFRHLGNANEKWQIEVYLHHAIIEFFELSERLKYKKGLVGERRAGQLNLANLIRRTNVELAAGVEHFTAESHINALRGAALKQNEDALDSIICAMIAANYAFEHEGVTYGNVDDGYIYIPLVPQLKK